MSEQNPTEIEKQQMRFTCGLCGAVSGVWCHTTPSRRNAQFLHADRYYQWIDDQKGTTR